ncbi:unnamed protein product, partial [Mesorhabditis spiculigera]
MPSTRNHESFWYFAIGPGCPGGVGERWASLALLIFGASSPWWTRGPQPRALPSPSSPSSSWTLGTQIEVLRQEL